VLKARVLEAGHVLGAVAEHSVDAEVRDPDQAHLDRRIGVGSHSDRREDDGRAQ